MKEDYRVFVQNLRKYMDMKNINQNRLAIALGVSRPTVSDWYNGNKMPRIEKLKEIAKILGVSVSDLLEKEYEKELILTADGIRLVALIEKCTPDQQSHLLAYARFYTEGMKK